MKFFPIEQVKGGYMYGTDFYKSKEEIYFSWYIAELEENGFIYGSGRPESITIFDAVTISIMKKGKVKEKYLLHDLVYTADFSINWREKSQGIFYDEITRVPNKEFKDAPFLAKVWNSPHLESIIDVKGGFSGIHNNSAVSFPIIQKILVSKFKLYVQKIIPQKLFKESFTPQRYFFSDGGTILRQKNWPYKTFREYVYPNSRPDDPTQPEKADGI